MEDALEEKFESGEISASRSAVVFFVISILFFLTSVVTMWQGILKLQSMNIANTSLRTVGKLLLTMHNSGATLLVVSFFTILFSILFAVYAVYFKSKK